MEQDEGRAAWSGRTTGGVRMKIAAAAIVTAVALLLSLAGARDAGAVPTGIDVRVLASGAKFIGSSVGGAAVTIRDARSGRLLAEGVTRGGTGDTKRIMRDAHPRNRVLSTPDAAKFHAVLDIAGPREIIVAARGPLGAPQAIAEASTRLWLLPGVDRTAGDGVLLELAGLIVAPASPPFHSVARSGETVPLETRVMMLCGCPIMPGGLWDAADFLVVAHVVDPDGNEQAIPLAPAGRPSVFAGGLVPRTPGVYRLHWIARQKSTGNIGRALSTLIVRAASRR